MVQQFTCSFSGEGFEIWYELHVFAKHDAWNEFGDGNGVKIPIRIV